MYNYSDKPSKLQVNVLPFKNTVLLETSTEISCIVSSPSEYWVRWLLNGKEIQNKTKLTGRLHKLTIPVVKQKNDGNYTCEVTDKYGRTSTSTSILNVDGKGVTI